MRINVAFALIASLFIFLWLSRRRRIPKGLGLPPGPPGKFIVGNSADLPSHHEWETYAQWAKKYGDLVHISVFGQSMVFINSMDIARELFDKRSSLYSDRFKFTMLSELMGFHWGLALIEYGQRWRRHRRVFHEYFHATAAVAYRDIESKHAHKMLREIHESPNDFIAHIRHFVGATILEIAYGIEVLPTNDPYIELAHKGMSALSEAGNAGTYLVDVLPILKYVPAWMPGAGFKRKARVWKQWATDMADLPFIEAKQALSTERARPSFTTSLLEKLPYGQDARSDQEEVIRNAAASAYAAGSDTTVAALEAFVLAMVLYPDAQRKAQEELERVVGTARLPVFEDRGSLPFVGALCKEVLRWHPVLPLAIVHQVTQDDVFGRYFIPGGSLVFGNAWAMLHDEKTYGPSPEKFIPERFLNTNAPDPTVAFGFGRRICPGRYMASDSLFIAVACVLQIFYISHARDIHGDEVPVRDSVTSGMLSHPEPFQCSIVPRSAETGSLISERTD